MKMIPSNDEDHKIIKYWCAELDLTFSELIHMWVEKVRQRKHIQWYGSLPDAKEVKRKCLENKKIGMFYKNR